MVDMLAINAHSRPAAHAALSEAVARLMASRGSPKLGFAFDDDLRRMERAMPGTTLGAEALYDLQRPATRALGLPRRRVAGLGAACELLLGIPLDKTQQTSDWSHRPLTQDQVAYAALDASVLHPLLEALGGLPSVERATVTRLAAKRSSPARSRRSGSTPDTSTRQSGGEGGGGGGGGSGGESSAGCSCAEQPDEVAMPLPAVTTRSLPLAGLEQMLSSYLGLPLGGREQVMRLCAGEEFVERLQTSPCELRSAGGGGTTVWEGGDTCLYINTANSRPNAGKYRNYFWRETAGELSGAVCMCWFPGRGQKLTDPSMRGLLAGDTTCLLLARKQPSRPYRFLGRLAAIAVASPQELETRAPLSFGEGAAGGGEGALRAWRTADDVAPHIIFRLLDAEALFDEPTSPAASASAAGDAEVEFGERREQRHRQPGQRDLRRQWRHLPVAAGAVFGERWLRMRGLASF